MSKRRGDVVLLDEFMDEVGVDAARWYLVNREPRPVDRDRRRPRGRADAEEPRLLRPVRARPDRRDPAERRRRSDPAEPPAGLAPEERDLIKRLADFPLVAAEATHRRAPQHIPVYAIRVADDFHRFYHEHRVLESGRGGVPARALPRDAER